MKKRMMKKSSFNLLSEKSRIGISVDSDSLEDKVIVQVDKYLTEPIKKLTKANSFTVLDEVFYIVKKDYTGKASRLYHVYRASDRRLVCPSVLDKEDTIKMVMDKYIDYM